MAPYKKSLVPGFLLFAFAAIALNSRTATPARGATLSAVLMTSAATMCPTPVATSTCSVPVGTPTISAINFSPANPTVSNPPSTGTKAKAATITVQLTAFDTTGKQISPSRTRPIEVMVFGAPAGAVLPTSQKITSGSTASFRYSGAYLANDLVLEAWIKNPKPSQTLGVYSLGSTLILRTNRQSPSSCTYQSTSYPMNTDCPAGTIPGDCPNMTSGAGIRISAAVGKLRVRSLTSKFHQYTVDTGSLGTLVPQDQVPSANPSPGEGMVVGPGGPGIRYYDSNGGTCYQGQYWLAPMTFGLASKGDKMTSQVSTHPIRILVVPDSHPLNYMGVGFDRNATTTGDYFDSPADNAFLNLTNTKNGSDISPGYNITPTQIRLGITSDSGFDTDALTPNQCVGGDYVTAPGCISFPALAPGGVFCGTVLMDTGIGDMFINIGSSSWPKGYCQGGLVPDDTQVQINSGTDTSSPACYSYAVNNSNPSPAPTPVTPAPSISNCIENHQDETSMFVNTGRHPLSWFTYLFDATCGQVGFMPNAQYEQTCP
ncbi:MAG TPA: hypothetical protein VMA09_23125 [Candidatus Binataceae bacterium]|nr:hypothetical protein [Candidatus Binataceae bacterium]